MKKMRIWRRKRWASRRRTTMEEEVKKNAFCKAELDKTEDTIKEKGYLQEDLEAHEQRDGAAAD